MPTSRSLRRAHVALPALALILAAALTGCGAAPPSPESPQQAAGAPPAPPSDAPAPAVAADESAAQRASYGHPAEPEAAPSPAGAKTAADGGADREIGDAPLIVYEGELAVRVEAGKGPASIDAIVALAESVGGHLAGRDEGRVVVKVPSRRFREAMTEVDRSFEVERRNVKAEDVTAEFKDMEVRLENLRATRKRLEQLLEKTGTLADTLSVEKELERVAGEIDRIQGRLRFLRNHTSFSRLTVAVTEKPKANAAVAAAAPLARRDLALPMPWIERVGVPALLDVPSDD